MAAREPDMLSRTGPTPPERGTCLAAEGSREFAHLFCSGGLSGICSPFLQRRALGNLLTWHGVHRQRVLPIGGAEPPHPWPTTAAEEYTEPLPEIRQLNRSWANLVPT